MLKIEPRLLKGFRDFAPSEQARRQAMFAKIQATFERFGFLPLSTPALEYKDILMGKYGEEEKLIYSFKDNGERDVALRYDLTVPLARYVAQNQGKLVLPFKRYQIAPVWRADNPQRGRFREFYQCDIDVVGVVSPLADAEVMACVYAALSELGLSNLELRFNNRLLFSRLFSQPDKDRAIILREVDKVEKIGADGVTANLKKAGLSEQALNKAQSLLSLGRGDEALKNIAEKFPDAASVTSAVRGVISELENLGVPKSAIVFDPLTVRGLDYYTNLVFEVRLKDRPEYGSMAGGGRYDGLVEQFSEKSLPAVGGSIGIDRLFAAMEESGLADAEEKKGVLVVNMEGLPEADFLRLVTELRQAGFIAEVYYEPAKLDKQLKYAQKKNLAFAVIMGEQEKAADKVQVKNLQTREQTELPRQDLVNYLKKL